MEILKTRQHNAVLTTASHKAHTYMLRKASLKKVSVFRLEKGIYCNDYHEFLKYFVMLYCLQLAF